MFRYIERQTDFRTQYGISSVRCTVYRDVQGWGISGVKKKNIYIYRR